MAKAPGEVEHEFMPAGLYLNSGQPVYQGESNLLDKSTSFTKKPGNIFN